MYDIIYTYVFFSDKNIILSTNSTGLRYILSTQTTPVYGLGTI